jgi:hypothetical protein
MQNKRTNLKARRAIDMALAGCDDSKERDALLFGVRLAIEVLKDTEEMLRKEVNQQ